jgi:hypothetical protein
MVYKCSRCHYTTDVKCNYDRHNARKTQCSIVCITNNGNGQNITAKEQNIIAKEQNITADRQNIIAKEQNITAKEQNITADRQNIIAGNGQNITADNNNKSLSFERKCPSTICKKCDMIFSKKRIKEHESKCNGLDSKQCPNCKKVFSFWQGKYAHKKNVDCEKNLPPPPSSPPPPPKNELHNNTHIHDATLTDVTLNNINNNIVINAFGKEEFEYLKENNNLLQELLKHSKKNVYGFADIIKEIHCNKDRPENHTIIKPLEYGDSVYIMGDDNEWEYREFEDVRDRLIDSVNRFVEICEEKRADRNIRFTDKKELNFIKQLCIKLLSIGGDVPIELLNALHIINTTANDKDEDDSLDKDNLRKFDKATMIKIHEFTQANYKKNNGTFVKN